MTPMTHNEAWQEVHVMACALIEASARIGEAVGVLNIGAELLAVRDALEALNHAALKSVSEVH